jgi:hypothetical protein
MGQTDSAPERNYVFEILPGDGQPGSNLKVKVADDTSITLAKPSFRSSWLASSFTRGYASTSSFLGQ